MKDKSKAEDRMAQVKSLQQNLISIRKIAGWTTEQLGNKIGVTKQTISNLETGKTPMSLTQYIAIRAVIDYEIQTNKENTVLPQVIEILIDKNNEFDEKKKEKIQEAVNTIAATSAGGIAGAQLATLFSGLLGGLGLVLGGVPGIIASSLWLKKILKDKDKE